MVNETQPPFDGSVYRAAMAYWIYQDRLMWSRTQLFVAVQAAAISAGYYLRGYPASCIVLMLGAMLTIFLLRLAHLDRVVRNKTLEGMKTFTSASNPAIEGFTNSLPDDSMDVKNRRQYLLWSGDGILVTIGIGLIIMDLALAVIFWNDPKGWFPCA